MDAVERYRKRRRDRLTERMRNAATPEEAQRLAIIIYTNCYRQDGGPGSGNWGHESVPGVRGGSKPGGGTSNRQGSAEKGYTSEAKEKEKAKKEAKSSSSSGTSAKKAQYKAKLKSEKEALLKEKPAEQALAMVEAGYLSYDEGVAAMRSKTASSKVEEYYAIMEENGDPTSEKPLADNKCNRNSDVESGKYSSHDEAKKGFVKERTGLSDEECDQISKEMDTWVSNSWSRADTAQIDKFIESDHTYDGEIYRGLHFVEGRDETSYDDFMKNIEVGGTISTAVSGRNASWSSSENDAATFSHRSNAYEDSVVIRCVGNRTSSPIGYLNNQGEKEVVSHSRARWTVLNVQESEKGSGGRHAEITVVECGEFDSASKGDGAMSEEKTESTESKFTSMLDRWDKSGADFVASPRKPKDEKSDED